MKWSGASIVSTLPLLVCGGDTLCCVLQVIYYGWHIGGKRAIVLWSKEDNVWLGVSIYTLYSILLECCKWLIQFYGLDIANLEPRMLRRYLLAELYCICHIFSMLNITNIKILYYFEILFAIGFKYCILFNCIYLWYLKWHDIKFSS